MIFWSDRKAFKKLKECSDKKNLSEWNKYRVETKHKPIDFRFRNLDYFYLENADLKSVNLLGASFRGGNFRNSDTNDMNISPFKYTFFYLFLYVSAILFIYLVANFTDISISKSVFYVSILISIFGSIFHPASRLFIAFILFAFIFIFMLYIFHLSDTYVLIAGLLLPGLFLIGYSTDQLCKRSEIIVQAKNPASAIGFNIECLKNKHVTISENIQEQIENYKIQMEKEEDETIKNKLIDNIDKLEEERQEALRKESITQAQQTKINNAILNIKKPYSYMDKNIFKLHYHNYFFYIIISVLLIVFFYSIFNGYLDVRAEQFKSILNKENVSFGAIFGVILFYGTPIILAMTIIFYAISQINRNLNLIEIMQEQKRSIDILESTLLAQAEVTEVSDDEIKGLTKKLQEGALKRMFTYDNKEKKEDNSPTIKYREKLLVNHVSKAFFQAIKGK